MLTTLRRARRAALCVLAGVIAVGSLQAQGNGTITGVVRSALTDSVLPGALVSLEGGTVNLQADATGRFHIEAPRGRQRLIAKALGFLPGRLTLEVRAAADTSVDI